MAEVDMDTPRSAGQIREDIRLAFARHNVSSAEWSLDLAARLAEARAGSRLLLGPRLAHIGVDFTERALVGLRNLQREEDASN
jgi:hypothetical protein